MGDAPLQTDIDAAKEAITVAERELQAAVGELSVAPRAGKATVSEVVRKALTKLRAAKARLVDLEQSLELAKRQAATVAVDEAEQYLDAVISEIEGVDGAGTTWTTKVVEDAFAKLKAAKAALADLESYAKDED